MAMFRHVRWLYDLIRVSNGPINKSRFANRRVAWWFSWLLALGDLLLSQRTTSEHTVKQACLSCCCIVRGGSKLQGFDRFPERIVLEVSPG